MGCGSSVPSSHPQQVLPGPNPVSAQEGISKHEVQSQAPQQYELPPAPAAGPAAPQQQAVGAPQYVQQGYVAPQHVAPAEPQQAVPQQHIQAPVPATPAPAATVPQQQPVPQPVVQPAMVAPVTQAASPQQTQEDSFFPSAATTVMSFGALPETLQDLHDGMPSEIADAPMRLLMIDAVLRWTTIAVYEDVQPGDCWEMPYSRVSDDVWSRTAVLSWRWGASKPAERQPGFTPMLPAQMEELQIALRRLRSAGLQYLWLDWCCVPQYSANSMVEVLRSKIFYARSHAMIIIPSYEALPKDGVVKLLLLKALRQLTSKAGASKDMAAAAKVLQTIMNKGVVAGREYFSRVWTLAERVARYGRSEQLSNWLSLEAWLGMLADALLKSTDNPAASQIYKKILGREAAQLLETITVPLGAAMTTGSMLGGAKGLEEQVARVFEMGAALWSSSHSLVEAPNEDWLLSYLIDVDAGVYTAWSNADRVWAVYSYFCWKTLNQADEASLQQAVIDLAQVAGGGGKLIAKVSRQLGLKLPLPDSVQQDLRANPTSQDLAVAAEAGDVARVRKLLADGVLPEGDRNGIDAVGYAAMHQRTEVLQAMVRLGVNVDKAVGGATPLWRACEANAPAGIPILVKAGADINFMNEYQEHKTPLVIAIEKNALQAVVALVEAGADTSVYHPDGCSPLYHAVWKGYAEIAKAIIKAGGDLNTGLDETKDSPLGYAAWDGQMEVVKALVEAGADLNYTNKKNETALDLARIRHKNDIATYLEEVAAGRN
uniref:NSG7 protein n=1 Tax=Chlamydomonas reinhardtii TaxID=3055 RepID=Q65Z19_CHLRE|nr:NSG7 protein [Chlamydomonas reinhardtii]